MKRESHSDCLRRNAGLDVRTAVRRILATFDQADAQAIEAGTRWYGTAQSVAQAISLETGHSLETVAAVIAHLSPRTTWARNVAHAWAVCLGQDPVGAMPANALRAQWAITVAQQVGDPMATLKGQKTQRFARNILGDRQAVTVDVWAARVVLLPDWSRGDRSDQTWADNCLGRSGVYGALEHAYRLAAKARGVDPATVQAVCWVVVRNGRAD